MHILHELNGPKRLRKCAVFVGVVILCVGVIAGCGSGPAASTNGDGTKAIRISNPANISNVPLHIAISKGFFKEEGLDVTADTDLGAGSTMEAVVGGQVDMAWSNTASIIAAYAAGLPVRLLDVTDTAVPGNTEVLVSKASPVRNLFDLEGRTLGVLSPITTCVWLVKKQLMDAGRDPESIRFVEVAPPDHPAALDSGNVDASCTSDPTKTQMVQELGARPIFDLMVDSPQEFHDNPVGGYTVSAEFAEQNRGTLEAFQRALNKAAVYANAHPDEVRATLSSYAHTDPQVAAQVSINKYVETPDMSQFYGRLESIVAVMEAAGVLEESVNINVPDMVVFS